MSIIEKINKKLNTYLEDNEVPNILYLGYQEYAQLGLKLKELENSGLTKKEKPKARPRFQGMVVFMVHAEQYIAFGKI